MIELKDIPREIRSHEQRRRECGHKDTETPQAKPVSQRLNSRGNLRATLRDCGWNKSETARRLGVDRSTVWRRMRQWDIPLDGGEKG